MPNRKIIFNCCLPAFLREVLISYVSNMIRMRLNNCTIFWKQWWFLHGLYNLQKIFPAGAIRRFIFRFFPNQNFSRNREAKLLRKRIALILQVKFEKRPWYQETDSMVVIITVSIIVFTKQPSTERYLANLIFTNNFVNF